jgi:hypothetical protein
VLELAVDALAGDRLSIGFMRSYENVGDALLTCADSCACEPQRLMGTWQQPHAKTSEIDYVDTTLVRDATAAGGCTLRVTVLPSSRAPKAHKVKLMAISTAGVGNATGSGLTGLQGSRGIISRHTADQGAALRPA